METTKINIGEVRFSYLHVFAPEAMAEGAKKKYSVSLIIPKSNTALVESIKSAIKLAYEGGIGTFGGKLPPKGTWKVPLRDGDIERPDDEAYKDSYFLNCSSVSKPGIVKPDPTGRTKFTPIIDEDELKSGDYGYASVNFYAFSASGNKGVACGLNNILKTRTGDSLAGRASADSDFGSLDISSVTESVENDDDIF